MPAHEIFAAFFTALTIYAGLMVLVGVVIFFIEWRKYRRNQRKDDE